MLHPPTRTTPRTRGRLIVGVAAVALLAAACGDSEPTAADGTDTSAPASAGAAVTIDTFMFNPDPLKVSVGDTVTWTNNDSILHTVTSGERDYEPGNSGNVIDTRKDGRFDESLDGKGSTASVTFDEAGTFHYFCDRHPGMEADIEVS